MRIGGKDMHGFLGMMRRDDEYVVTSVGGMPPPVGESNGRDDGKVDGEEIGGVGGVDRRKRFEEFIEEFSGNVEERLDRYITITSDGMR